MNDLLSSSSGRYLIKFFAAGSVYAAVAFGSLYLISPDGSGASLVWPVAAVGLTTLWLLGTDLWPGLLLGLFLVLLARGYTPALAAGVSVGNILESLIGCYLLGLAGFSPMLSRLRDTLSLIAVSIITTFFSSLWIVSVSLLFYRGDGGTFNSSLWSALWVGHGVSLLMFGPFLLYWANRPTFHKTRQELFEGIIVFGAIAGLSYLISWTHYSEIGSIPIIYFLVIALVWASLRTGPRGISLSLAIITSFISTGVLFGSITSPQPVGQELFGMQVLVGVLGIIFLPFTSITEERKDAVRKLEHHVGQLEGALTKIQSEDQAKTDFIAILAHELRNPLSPILSSLELIKQADTEKQDDVHVLSISSHVHMMARLLDDLLDISRISQKKFKIEMEPVELGAIIRQTLEMVRPFMEARKHDLIVKLPPESVWLTADPVRLAQIFVNLLNNAAKYTDPGGRIVLAAKKEGGSLVVTIKDNGIGIAPERLHNVFEPFGGSEGVERKPGGLRIGMSLAKRMVEMHRGTIAVSSAGTGEGTQFTVTLPLPPTSPLPLEQAPRRGIRRRFSSEAAPRYANQSGETTILVVDDNEPAANALAALLRGNNHEVSVAYTGADGLALCERQRPDVALLDIGLPDMDGHELARNIREKFGNNILLLALTGFGQAEDKMKAREAGFDEHLTKPVSILDVERIIRELRGSN